MTEIYLGSKRSTFRKLSRRVVVYEADGTRRVFDSISHCARTYQISYKTVQRLLKCDIKGDRIDSNGNSYYYGKEDPNRRSPTGEWVIDPVDDLPVIMFDKENNQALARFKSVTFCAQCLSRPVKTVFSWLQGQRCTDVDCYYKYERDCTKYELDNMFKL